MHQAVREANAYTVQGRRTAQELLKLSARGEESPDRLTSALRAKLHRDLLFATRQVEMPDTDEETQRELQKRMLTSFFISSQVGAERLDENEAFMAAALARVAGRAPFIAEAKHTIAYQRASHAGFDEQYRDSMHMTTNFMNDLKSLIEQYDMEFGMEQTSEQKLIAMIFQGAPVGSIDIDVLRTCIKGARHEYIAERMLETIPEFTVVHDPKSEGVPFDVSLIEARFHTDIIVKYRGGLYGIDIKSTPQSANDNNAKASLKGGHQNKLWSGISESEFRGSLIPIAPGTHNSHESVMYYAEKTQIKERVLELIESGHAIRIPRHKVAAQ